MYRDEYLDDLEQIIKKLREEKDSFDFIGHRYEIEQYYEIIPALVDVYVQLKSNQIRKEILGIGD